MSPSLSLIKNIFDEVKNVIQKEKREPTNKKYLNEV